MAAMRHVFRSVAAIAALLLLAQAARAQHRIAVQGNGKLAIVERGGELLWQFPWGPIHDLCFSPSGTLMVQQGASKVAEIDIAKREIIWTYDSATANGNAGQRVEVHAFQPLADGRVMIAESGPARIIEVDRTGKLLHAIKLKVDHPNAHTDTRLARKLNDGHFLVCHEGDGVVREYDEAGRVTWEYSVPLFGQLPRPGHGPEAYGNKCFAAICLPTGNTLISTGNGHGLIEVTPQKEIVWQIRQHDLPKITLAWVTTIEVLPNGRYVIGNCHAGPGQPLAIELEPKTKEVVWTLDRYETFGNSVSTTQILDGGSGVLR
jgi:outer membrane protein assembly factor BamB